MKHQISIFEYLEQTDRSFEDMTVQEIAQTIADKFGKKAEKLRFEGYYGFKMGNCAVEVHKSRYNPLVNNGAWHIGVSLEYKNGGMSCPCDSLDEAINRVERWIENHKT